MCIIYIHKNLKTCTNKKAVLREDVINLVRKASYVHYLLVSQNGLTSWGKQKSGSRLPALHCEMSVIRSFYCFLLTKTCSYIAYCSLCYPGTHYVAEVV